MKNNRILSFLLAAVMLLTMVPVSFAADNSTQATAIPIQPGQEVTFTTENGPYYWYSIETTQPGQVIQVVSNYGINGFYDPAGNHISNYSSTTSSGLNYRYVLAEKPGVYGFNFYYSNSTPRDYVFTATLLENDAHEPNSSMDTAVALTSGVPAEFILNHADTDYFTIETTRDGQDVQLDFSGFNYATADAYFYAYFDGIQVGNSVIDGNNTYYFHAEKAGKHTIQLSSGCTNEPFTVTATVLKGDANEPNDTPETAARLPIGTDTAFSMGGYGDEDWFTFESAFDAGESSKMYTLNLMDLRTDYADQLYYDLYAPDGTQLMDEMYVKIRHSNVIACEQEGLYALRLYRDSKTAPRSELRIRLDEGGADPYEYNDTWLTAPQAQTEQPIQFILSNTEDVDWFKFEVPAANMIMHLAGDSRVEYRLFSAGQLEEFGDTDYHSLSVFSLTSGENYYYKFDEPGTYYLRLNTGLSYASQNLRTITITLDEARDTENNDTRQTATPIYAGVPVEFDITAWNDYDWFVFEVPEGITQLLISGDDVGRCALYRGEDFELAGDDAAPVAEGWNIPYTFSVPAAGTYYLRCSTYYNHYTDTQHLNATITCHLITETLPGNSIQTAQPLPEGQWTEDIHGGYYSIGTLKAGDQLRLYTDNINQIDLYTADGVNIDWSTPASYQHYNWNISVDGAYYLKVDPYTDYKENGRHQPYRLLYDIVDRNLNEGERLTIEGPDSITVAVGETAKIDLRAAPYDAKGTTTGIFFAYTSGWNSPTDTSIASPKWVTGRGPCVSGNAVGSTVIEYYICYDDNSHSDYKSITVHVVEPTAAQSISISGAPAQLPLSTAVTLNAALTPADSTDSIVWSSSDPKTLYVDAYGTVTAIGDGSAVITATASSGVSDSVTIEVTAAPAKEEVTGLTLNDYDLTLYMGEEGGQLTATVSPADSAASVKWISSNLTAATVDQTGKITPVAPSVAVITASAGDYRASCIVTVLAERVRVENIAFDQAVLEIPLSGETTLRPNFTPSNATVQSMTWASSDPNVAAVSRTGIVTALAVGETTITATTLDGGKTASILIRVTAAPQLGDINGDGYIDAADAMITLQVAVEKVELTEAEAEAADVNNDGWVDAADAVRILRYDAGLIDSLRN